MMIGLTHHHMSYSPASTGQARLNAAGGKPSSPHATNSTATASNNHKTNKIRESSQCRQLVAGELAVDDSVRALRVHKLKEQAEELQQQQHIRHQQQQFDVVQVPASVVMPTIVVDSVPKCARQARPSRGHSATGGQQQTHMYQRPDIPAAQSSARTAERHFLLHEQRRREEADNQVVLIMSDTGAAAGANGVPIIGRRLPSKSMDSQAAHHRGSHHAAPPTTTLVATPSGPVVGRRSHRMLSGQLAVGQEQPQLLKVAESSQQRHQLRRAVAAPSQRQRQPLRIIEAHSTPSECIQLTNLDCRSNETMAWLSTSQQQQLVSKKKRPTKKKMLASSNSCSSLSQCDPRLQQLPPGVSPALAELCSGPCCRPGPPSDHLPRYSSRRVPQEILSQPCTMPCCALTPITSEGRPTRAARPKSSSIRSANSRNQHQHQHQHQHQMRLSYPALNQGQKHNHATCQANSSQAPYELTHETGLVGGVARRSSSLCRQSADEAGAQAPTRPRGQTNQSHLLMPVTASHLYSAQPCQTSRPQQPPPVPNKPCTMSIHRELLLQHSLSHQMQQEQEQEAVTQMYESLAAELKAKLGNPNRAPILLPPKDYDTLSRQQGKLSGIDLRRSTNPQLVGPAVACLNAAARTNTTRNNTSEELAAICDRSSESSSTGCSSGPATTSASLASPDNAKISPQSSTGANSNRSSGRSSQDHHQHEPHHRAQDQESSLQRSRSNSSSGLGSISISSPDQQARSSPSHSQSPESSETDLAAKLANSEFGIVFGSSRRHLASHEQQQQQEADSRRGRGIENHNPSKVSDGVLWNGRVEVPLKVNNERRNGNTYLATKQIIY